MHLRQLVTAHYSSLPLAEILQTIDIAVGPWPDPVMGEPADPPIGGGSDRKRPPLTKEEEDLNKVPCTPYEPYPGSGGTPTPETGGGPTCCPKELNYPEPDSVKPVPASGATYNPRVGVGFTFQFSAQFTPGSEVAGCDCDCCVFRQYKKFTLIVDGQADPRDSGYTEDFKLNRDGTTTRYGDARGDDKSKDDPKKNVEGNRYYDADDRGAGKDGKGGGGPSGEAAAAGSGCRYKGGDSPAKVGLAAGAKYNLTWDFIGRIHDRCNQMIPVRTKRLLLFRSGYIKEGYVDPETTKGTPTTVQDDPLIGSGSTQAPAEAPEKAWTGESSTDGSKSMPGTRV
jgi:hypothetical protein